MARITHTRTFALLEISPSAFEEIRAAMIAGGSADAVDGERVDMHGIAVVPEKVAGPGQELRWRKLQVAVHVLARRLLLERRSLIPLPAKPGAVFLPALAKEEYDGFVRADGDVICSCGLTYYDHPAMPGQEYLTILCSSQLVKL